MIKINLLSVLEAERSETRQTFFDLDGIFEGIDLEKEYARLAWEERKKKLEEEHGYDFDDLDSATNIDLGFQSIFKSLFDTFF